MKTAAAGHEIKDGNVTSLQNTFWAFLRCCWITISNDEQLAQCVGNSQQQRSWRPMGYSGPTAGPPVAQGEATGAALSSASSFCCSCSSCCLSAWCCGSPVGINYLATPFIYHTVASCRTTQQQQNRTCWRRNSWATSTSPCGGMLPSLHSQVNKQGRLCSGLQAYWTGPLDMGCPQAPPQQWQLAAARGHGGGSMNTWCAAALTAWVQVWALKQCPSSRH